MDEGDDVAAPLWQVRVEWDTVPPLDPENASDVVLDYLTRFSAGAVRLPTEENGDRWGTHLTVQSPRIAHAVRTATSAVEDACTAAGLVGIRVLEVEAKLMPASGQDDDES